MQIRSSMVTWYCCAFQFCRRVVKCTCIYYTRAAGIFFLICIREELHSIVIMVIRKQIHVPRTQSHSQIVSCCHAVMIGMPCLLLRT